MVPARPGDTVCCGNRGAQVGAYARPDDDNEIPFLAAHTLSGEDLAAAAGPASADGAAAAVRKTTYTASLRGDTGRLVADIPAEFATEAEAIDNARTIAADRHPDALVIDLYAKTTINDTLIGYPHVGWAWTTPPARAAEAVDGEQDQQGGQDAATAAGARAGDSVFTTGPDAAQRSMTHAEYEAWWDTLTPGQKTAELDRALFDRDQLRTERAPLVEQHRDELDEMDRDLALNGLCVSLVAWFGMNAPLRSCAEPAAPGSLYCSAHNEAAAEDRTAVMAPDAEAASDNGHDADGM